MLAVGTLGTSYIGTLQATKEIEAVASNETIVEAVPALIQDGELTVLEEKKIYEIIEYKTISEEKLAEAVASLPAEEKASVEEQLSEVRAASKQGALANMCIFPMIMLGRYVALSLYFASRGGYKAQGISSS